MVSFGRKKVAEAAQEIADHLHLVENVKALQEGQRMLADALRKIEDHIKDLERDFAVLKAEIKLEALKEARDTVYAFQAGFNDRLERLAIQVHGGTPEPPVAEAVEVKRLTKARSRRRISTSKSPRT